MPFLTAAEQQQYEVTIEQQVRRAKELAEKQFIAPSVMRVFNLILEEYVYGEYDDASTGWEKRLRLAIDIARQSIINHPSNRMRREEIMPMINQGIWMARKYLHDVGGEVFGPDSLPENSSAQPALAS